MSLWGAWDFDADDEDLPTDLIELPELQDAVERVLQHSGITNFCTVEVGCPVPTSNPAVDFIVITVSVFQSPLPLEDGCEVWIDGYELCFTFVQGDQKAQ